MTHVEDELNSQPECWTRAAQAAPGHGGALPAAGERVAIVGCGTSYFMAQAAAALREGAGQGESRWPARPSPPPKRRPYRSLCTSTMCRATNCCAVRPAPGSAR